MIKMEKIDCDICGNEINGNYRILNLNYTIKETKPKVSPYKEKNKWDGYMPIYGDICIGGSGRVIGVERFIKDAKICLKCNDNVERALDKIKKLFE